MYDNKTIQLSELTTPEKKKKKRLTPASAAVQKMRAREWGDQTNLLPSLFIGFVSTMLVSGISGFLGAILGGIIGSAFPGIGTVIGASIGGALFTSVAALIAGQAISKLLSNGIYYRERILVNTLGKIPGLKRFVDWDDENSWQAKIGNFIGTRSQQGMHGPLAGALGSGAVLGCIIGLALGTLLIPIPIMGGFIGAVVGTPVGIAGIYGFGLLNKGIGILWNKRWERYRNRLSNDEKSTINQKNTTFSERFAHNFQIAQVTMPATALSSFATGAAIGVFIGFLVPGIGNIVGGLVGGCIGAVMGGTLVGGIAYPVLASINKPRWLKKENEQDKDKQVPLFSTAALKMTAADGFSAAIFLGAAGGLGGVLIGGIVGSIFPGIGTAVGVAVGGIVGTVFGSTISALGGGVVLSLAQHKLTGWVTKKIYRAYGLTEVDDLRKSAGKMGVGVGLKSPLREEIKTIGEFNSSSLKGAGASLLSPIVGILGQLVTAVHSASQQAFDKYEGVNTNQNVLEHAARGLLFAGLSGGLAGSAIGVSVGTIFPGVGNSVGLVVGALAGFTLCGLTGGLVGAGVGLLKTYRDGKVEQQKQMKEVLYDHGQKNSTCYILGELVTHQKAKHESLGRNNTAGDISSRRESGSIQMPKLDAPSPTPGPAYRCNKGLTRKVVPPSNRHRKGYLSLFDSSSNHSTLMQQNNINKDKPEKQKSCNIRLSIKLAGILIFNSVIVFFSDMGNVFTDFIIGC